VSMLPARQKTGRSSSVDQCPASHGSAPSSKKLRQFMVFPRGSSEPVQGKRRVFRSLARRASYGLRPRARRGGVKLLNLLFPQPPPVVSTPPTGGGRPVPTRRRLLSCGAISGTTLDQSRAPRRGIIINPVGRMPTIASHPRRAIPFQSPPSRASTICRHRASGLQIRRAYFTSGHRARSDPIQLFFTSLKTLNEISRARGTRRCGVPPG